MTTGCESGSAGVRAYFERAAESFDSLYSEERQSVVMRWLNRHFRRDIAERFIMTREHVRQTGAQSVLDVGCGSGRYIAALAKIGVRRLVGVDLSEPMLRLARQETSSGHDSQIEFVRADIHEWEPPETVDTIISMGVYDYIADPVKILAKKRRIARRSVIASFPSRHWFRTPIRRIRYRIKRCPVYFYRRSQIEALGRAAGFARTEVTKIRGAGMDYVATFWTS